MVGYRQQGKNMKKLKEMMLKENWGKMRDVERKLEEKCGRQYMHTCDQLILGYHRGSLDLPHRYGAFERCG